MEQINTFRHPVRHADIDPIGAVRKVVGQQRLRVIATGQHVVAFAQCKGRMRLVSGDGRQTAGIAVAHHQCLFGIFFAAPQHFDQQAQRRLVGLTFDAIHIHE